MLSEATTHIGSAGHDGRELRVGVLAGAASTDYGEGRVEGSEAADGELRRAGNCTGSAHGRPKKRSAY